MKRIRSTLIMVSVLTAMGLASAMQPVSAGVEAECRQEVEDFGVMPELREDYISGCIDSRGGVSTSAGAEEDYVPPSEPEEDYVPPSEPDDINSPEAGNENTRE